MRKLFLRAVLATILASCILTAGGVGVYGALELSHSSTSARDQVFHDVENRFHTFGEFLEIAYTRMKGTSKEALMIFAREYPDAKSAFSAPSEDLKGLAKRIGVDDLYVLDNSFVVRATSLPEDLGLDLDRGKSLLFRDFLETVLGSGEVWDHGLSISIRSSQINGYFYYSPPGSDYILETSIGTDTALSQAFGETFYSKFISSLFSPMRTQSADVLNTDVFVFDGQTGISFLGNAPDPYLTSDTVGRLKSGEKIAYRKDWIRTEYRAASLNESPLSFMGNVFVRISFDQRRFLNYILHIIAIVAVITLTIAAGAYVAVRPFFDTMLLKRLETLSSKIDAVADGDYGVSFDDPRSDELAQIGTDIEHMIAVIVDKEERLRDAQQSELVALFAGGIVHDFNNLLNTVAGAASLLEERASSLPSGYDREIVDSAELIKTAASRAGAMTRDLVSLTRSGDTAQTLKPVDIGALLSEVTRLFSRSLDPSISFSSGPFPNGMILLGDETRLRSLFLNLLINAEQALSEPREPQDAQRGEIKISAGIIEEENRTLDAQNIEAEGPLRYCEILVSDNGPGIPRETRDRIFTPFFTTKSKGTGVGLSMAKATAAALGGDILLREPNTGRGAVFAVILPLLTS